MIGNDIVDLEQARLESNWRRKGFLAKLFTAYEQQLIWSASDPDRMVWLLWSMKESAYKVIVRETGQRFFAPGKLACRLNGTHSETIEGSVFYGIVYTTSSLSTTRYVASVAYPSDTSYSATHQIISFDQTDYPYQHRTIRDQLKQHYVTRFPDANTSIHIQKNDVGVPSVYIRESSGKTSDLPISLSHHGHYGAFATLHQVDQLFTHPKIDIDYERSNH